MSHRLLNWKSMVLDPPTETGRYAVCHRGGVCGDAFFWTDEDFDVVAANYPDGNVPHMKRGWNQVPSWGPTHYIEPVKTPIDDPTPRVWPTKVTAPQPPRPECKRSWLERLFGG